MNNRSQLQIFWLRRKNFTGAFAAGGALSFPVFMLIASLAIVLVSGAYQSADALVRSAPVKFTELQPLVDLVDDSALATELEDQLSNSAVVSGRWQPVDRVVEEAPAVQREMIVTVETPVVAPAPVRVDIEPPPIQPVLEVVATKVVKRQSTANLRGTKQQAREALAAHTPLVAYQLLMVELETGAADTEYLGLLAVAALASEKAREANLIYERLVVLEPDNEQWWAGLAISRDHIGLDAAADYERALAISEDDSAVSQLARSRLQGTG